MRPSLKLVCSLSVIIVTTNTWANHNGCESLEIQIGNATNAACRLISTNIIHGSLVSAPPAVILSGYTERFTIHQTVYGPHILLEYNCDNKRIKIKTQQNFCFLKAGKITTETLYSAGVEAMATNIPGSYLWDKPGFANWTFNG